MISLSRLLRTAIVAALALPLSGMAASATEATATTALNVRTGPSAGYPVVDTLTPGEVVDVTECESNGWCYITHPGPDGWVSSTYLTAGPSAGSTEPNCSFRLVFGPGGTPRFEIVCGDGPFPGTGTGPVLAANRACFFDGPNFTGASFCRQVGVFNNLPPISNDRITSVRLHGNAKVRLCVNPNMGPFCRDVVTSEGGLGGFLNNKVSSLRVYTGYLPPKKQACLFDGSNYTGQYLCYGVGTFTLPPAAQNRTTSVRLFGASGVRISKSATYGIGGANNLTSNTPALPPFWNNQTKSIRVY